MKQDQPSNMKLTTKLLFRLLPVQVFLALVGSINGIVSSLFASNYVGVDAMTAVGLYNPVNMLIGALSLMLVGGATILCGKLIGRNEPEKVQSVFSLSNLLSVAIAAVFIILFLIFGIFDLTGFLASDPVVRPIFNKYLVGQSFGVLPLLMGNQLASFLSLENKIKRTTFASFVYMIVNVILNYLFVCRWHMEAFGLALASSLGLWIFCLIQAQFFMTKDAPLKLFSKNLIWSESLEIVKIGIPGAASNAYQTLRGLIVNELLVAFVGSVGISAFTAADTLLRFWWALPTGMVAVSRMLLSISVGEEDKKTLTDVMRNMFFFFVPLMAAISAVTIICAKPLALLYYQDTTQPVYMMTVWGFRILPICMPLSVICMHFVCYAQASGKQVLVHLLSVLDGVVCVAGFTALLIRTLGQNSVYVANVLNGVVTTIVIIVYAIIYNKRFPRNMAELMAVPRDFGVAEDQRMDLSVQNMAEVVTIAKEVQSFCLEHGIDSKRSYLAGLFLEEMAGNVVDHGFHKDKKKHTVDIRVVHKDDNVILRIKDDCVPFNPQERAQIVDPEDITKNIGIRMVYKLTDRIDYQNILGLNVLTIRL